MRKKIAGLALFLFSLHSVYCEEYSVSIATPWVSRDAFWLAHSETIAPLDELQIINIAAWDTDRDGEKINSASLVSVRAYPKPFSLSASFLTFDLPETGADISLIEDNSILSFASLGYDFEFGSMTVTPAFVPVYVPSVRAVVDNHTMTLFGEGNLGGLLTLHYTGVTGVIGYHAITGNIRFDGIPVGSVNIDSCFALLGFSGIGLGYAHLGGESRIRAYSLVSDSLGVAEEMDAHIDVNSFFFFFSLRREKNRLTASIDAAAALLWSRDSLLENDLTINGEEYPYWLKADFDPEFLYFGRFNVNYRIRKGWEISVFRYFSNSLSEGAFSNSVDSGSGQTAVKGADISFPMGNIDPLTICFAGLGVSVEIHP